MSDKTGIQWHAKSAAKRIGVSFEEYAQHTAAGEKWCTGCRAWHQRSEFGRDANRSDGLAATCLKSKRVRQPRLDIRPFHRHGWIKPTRDGDKKQARRRVNYLVEQGRIPRPEDLPCMDCGDGVFSGTYRHEYDHAQGYDGENQLYVEAVCSKCHRNREDARRGR